MFQFKPTSIFLTLAIKASIVAGLFDPPNGSNFGIPGNATYDYVIVGGGTAGLTVASRLAEHGRFSVGVLEAGMSFQEVNGNHSIIPGYDFQGFGNSLGSFNPLTDWGFYTTPQPMGLNRTLLYARGKGVGGSSARNYLVYQRPTKGAMQMWADEVGDQSWSWDNVLPFFERSTQLSSLDTRYRQGDTAPAYFKTGRGCGPISVGFSRYASPIGNWSLAAFREAGSPQNGDGFSSGSLIGNEWIPSTLNGANQERSTAAEYIKIGSSTGHLTIYTNAFVQRVLFADVTAKGVELITAGQEYTIKAKKEVILAAGAFQTPQLLMVSGIGPKKLLTEHRIPIIHDLPGVGQNLNDNPGFGVSFAVTIDTVTSVVQNSSLLGEAIMEYNTERSGFLTSSGADAINFEKVAGNRRYQVSPETAKDLYHLPADWPEIQYWPLSSWPGGSGTDENIASFVIGLVAPFSRGFVSIRSGFMSDPPIVDPQWLSHRTDRDLAVAAIRRARTFLSTTALKPILVRKNNPETNPGSQVISDDEILSAIGAQLSTFYHAGGTCKMGKASDEMAVIDSEGKVYGVKRLRVVDMSGIPFLPPGQPQATAYMIGEKLAHQILKEQK